MKTQQSADEGSEKLERSPVGQSFAVTSMLLLLCALSFFSSSSEELRQLGFMFGAVAIPLYWQALGVNIRLLVSHSPVAAVLLMASSLALGYLLLPVVGPAMALGLLMILCFVRFRLLL